MKIDFLEERINNFIFKFVNSDCCFLSIFDKLKIQPNSPVWKNKLINDNQMDAKPSEETQTVSEDSIQKEPEKYQLAVEKETTQSENGHENQEETEKQEKEEQSNGTEPQNKPESQDACVQKQEEEPSEILQPPPVPQLEHKHRIIVKHSILGNKIPSHDPNVLVESISFSSVGKIQPFLITISTNAALVMDYHCHLTTSEVCGYLAGNWDVNSHNLNITDAFPCKCRLGDYESAPLIESEIRKNIKTNGLTLVGWYHSHPTAPATPSIRDIETQLDYQLRMKGNNDSAYLPCIGIICSPYNIDNPTLESTIVCYWVVPPPENKIHEYGKPMVMTYNVLQDQAISHDVLLEMKKCSDYYKPEKDYICFSEIVKGSVTFIEKLKQSVIPKFPLNHQKGDALWNYIQDITIPSKDKTETEILKEIIEISSRPSVTPPPVEKSKTFNIPVIPPPLSPLSFKSTNNNSSTCNTTPSYYKSHSRSKSSSSSSSSGKRSNSRDNKNLASLNNYFVGSDLAALFGPGKFPGMGGLDPATKSLLNLNSLSLGGMFLPPMAAAAAAAAAYKPDPGAGLMKPPPPPPNSYYSFPTSRNSSNIRTSTGSTSRSQNRSIPSTSRDMPPPNKVPKIDSHQMSNYFIPPNLGKNCTITNRPSTSTSSK